MNVTKTKQIAQNKVSNAVKPGTLKLPQPLVLALQHFFEFNEDPNKIKNELIKILHYAFESTSMDVSTVDERSNMFFTVRELGTLVDAIFLQKKLLTKK